MSTIECRNCGYEWTPRKQNPKSCPLCKRYIVVPEKMRLKRLAAFKILEPEITGIYFDCSKCGQRDAARFRFKKELLCPECAIEAIREIPPVTVPA